MAVPFSNTHLRVPRGFSAILEGLAREVLRQQPQDIPTYAAIYFDGLLKEREESGVDPAEWAAQLEDRFYNNHAFKAIPPGKPATAVTSSTEEKSQTEDEASGQVSSPPTTQPDGVTGDVQESDNRGTEEKVTTEEELSQEESDAILPVVGVSGEDCGDEEEDELLLTTSNKIDQDLIENDIQFSTDKDISQSELDNTNVLLSLGNSMRDVCAEELGAIEHDEDPTIEEQETALADDEIRATSDDQNTTDTEKATEEFPYSGLADVDVCAGELQQTYEANAVDEDLNASIAKEEELPGDSLLSQSRPPTASLQEVEPQEKKTLENREQTETHSGDTHEFLLSTEDAGHHMQEIEKILDTDGAPQEEGLVEINFDDVPEVEEIIETEDQQPGDECSVVEQSEQRSESQSREDIIRAESGHGEDGVQNIDEPTSETERQEKEVKTDGEESDDHKAADISMEMDASDLGFSNACYEGGLNETILSGQSSAETTNLEIKTDFDNDHETDNEDANEAENQGNKGPEPLNTYNETEDPPEDTIEDEMREISGEVIEDTLTGLFSEMEEKLPSEFDDVNAGRKSNISKPEKEEEEESENITVEESPVEMKERPLTPMEPQPEDTMEETEDTLVMPQTTGADDLPEEVAIDDEGQGRSSAVGEGSIESYHLTAGWAHDDISQEDQRPPETEKDVVDPETKDDDKEEECSRPQEEEEDIMDIPLDDPEANKAAAKIQAGFRGHMTRKKMKPEEKAEGEEVSSTGEALNGSQGGTETGGAGAVEGDDDTSVPEQ